MTGEASNRESEPDEPIDGEASDDEPVDGAASFPVGSWVRHAALGPHAAKAERTLCCVTCVARLFGCVLLLVDS